MSNLPAIRSPRELSMVLGGELPSYLHKVEIDAILDSVRGKPKEHLLVNMLWQTGARVSEVLNIKVADIDFYGKAIKILTLKRRKRCPRVIPLQNGLIGEIGAYIAMRNIGREERLLPFSRVRAYQIVNKAARQAGVERKRAHPHVFRHSFAVNAVLQNVPILVIKEWLGHACIQNTLIYMKILGSDTRRFYEELKF